ncbi:membrane-bound alpha-1,6- mannosyltransferase Initiation-specific [Loxospora ochrophaea]|nr:membrane-bound alpha-1,6- mannosyltransferase Initiation-specific [Loxospora ochrophaea]
MLTFRKAAILAVFALTLIFFFRSSHTSPPKFSIDTAEGAKTKDAGINRPKAMTTTAATTTTPSPVKATALPKSTSAKLSRPYPPPRVAQQEKSTNQQTLNNVENKPLRERLQYQFPYVPEDKFPAYIWQTWKFDPSSGQFGESLRPAEASWSELHPGFVHEVITDKTAVNLIKYLYASVPEVLDAYRSLPLPVLKADFFRYLILLARGGIYSDIDTTALKSVTDWIPEDIPRSTIGLVVGIEADPDRPDWHEWYSRRIQFCQWTIQAKPGHPVLRDVVATITEDTLRMKKLGILKSKKLDKTIVEFTGPAVWTDAVFSYMNNPEYYKIEKGGKNITWEAFTNIETSKKVGDVVVLPITSFSPGVGQMNAKEPDDPMAFVRHDFEGTWKSAAERMKMNL